MHAKCDKILAHGCNLFINRQLIYNLAEQYMYVLLVLVLFLSLSVCLCMYVSNRCV
jgi:hypothetical protein